MAPPSSVSSIQNHFASILASLPPGIPFVTTFILNLLFPILILHYTFYFTQSLYSTPLYLRLSSYVLVNPLRLLVWRRWTDFVNGREARKRGAVMPPLWEGKGIGSLDLLNELFEKYHNDYLGEGLNTGQQILGPIFTFRILWDDQYFTTEPDHIKALLATDFQSYEKGPEFHQMMKSVLGEGVFNSDGTSTSEMWKFHRSMTRPFFARDRISDYDNFERHAMRMINAMKTRLREGVAVDFQDAVSRFTLDSATQFLFGSCVQSLSDSLPYPPSASASSSTSPKYPSDHAYGTETLASRFSTAFLAAQQAVAVRSRRGNIWPLFEIRKDVSREPMREVRGFVEPIVRAALERKRQRVGAGAGGGMHSAAGGVGVGGYGGVKEVEEAGEAETLLDHLVALTDDPIIIRDETINILLAGRDTTAATLTFGVYLFALYPAVFHKLRDEVLAKVGKVPSSDGNGEEWRRPTYDDVRDMKYLRAVINEILRLYPAVPFNIRTSTQPVTLPPTKAGGKPYYIPKGSPVSYSVFMMHRREDLWGPDALEFDPDRWMDARLHKYVTPNPFIFLPFNAGPRICLGQQFAYNSISYMLIRLCQHFSSIELALDDAQPRESLAPASWAGKKGLQGREKLFAKTHLTNYIWKGCWVRMRPSEDDDDDARAKV